MATESPQEEVTQTPEGDDQQTKTSGSLKKQTRFAETVDKKDVIEIDTENDADSSENVDSGITLTGKVKGGSHAGEEVEVHLDLTDEELEHLNTSDKQTSGMFGADKGPHITLMAIFCFPAALIASLCVSFYFGALTWYNLYIYFSEERTMWHKIFLCPVLILTFPFTVGLSALGVALYAGVVQISWYFISWKTEFLDFEKGFYSWLCGKFDLPQCSPYDIVVLNEDSELERLPTKPL